MLISDTYRLQNIALHHTNALYGMSGAKRAGTVLDLRARWGCDTVLDYGCGKGTLAAALPFPIAEYDPAVPGKDAAPTPADLVVCSDVLEHIEPECLDAVIAHLHSLMRVGGYFMIHTGPAIKTLPDGRNAHLIQRPRAWWEEKLSTLFKVKGVYEIDIELNVFVMPK